MSFELVVSIGRIGSISINEFSIQSFLRFSRLSIFRRVSEKKKTSMVRSAKCLRILIDAAIKRFDWALPGRSL